MKKGRSSIITIIIVLIMIALCAYGVIRYIEKHPKEEEEPEIGYEYTNFQEEDFMLYEYDKLDESLNGLYAIAIKEYYIVGVKAYNQTINLFQIDPNSSYTYAYDNGNLYIAENDTGRLVKINLKTLDVELDEMVLNPNIKDLEAKNETIYYIADNTYYEYNGADSKAIYDNVTSTQFILKNSHLYICLDKNFYNIDEDGKQKRIDSNVEDIHYKDYYERDKIIYDKLIDEDSASKNIYNIYNETTINYITNNTYFVAYGANEYIYTTKDEKSVVLIKENNTNKYLYKCENEEVINNVNFYKEGYIIVATTTKNTIIDLSVANELISDNIINLQKIKYLK